MEEGNFVLSANDSAGDEKEDDQVEYLDLGVSEFEENLQVFDKLESITYSIDNLNADTQEFEFSGTYKAPSTTDATKEKEQEENEEPILQGMELLRYLYSRAFQPYWGQIEVPTKQPVVIESFTLISLVVNSKYLNWENSAQTLSAIYLLEHLLFRLYNNGWDLRIVFFAKVEQYIKWPTKAKALVANILKMHILSTIKTKYAEVSQFDSWRSKSWQEYVKNEHPAFLILEISDLAKIPSDSSEDNGYCLTSNSMLQLMTLELLAQEIRCVSSNIRFLNSRLWTFDLMPTVVVPWWSKQMSHKEAAKEESQDKQNQDEPKKDLSKMLAEFTTTSVAKALKANSTNSNYKDYCALAKCFLLHQQVARVLSIEERSFDETTVTLTGSLEETTRSFLNEVLANLLEASDSLIQCIDTEEGTTITKQLIDLVDGRLLFAVVKCIANFGEVNASNIGLNEERIAELDCTWSAVASKCDCSAKLFEGFCFSSKSESPQEPQTVTMQNDAKDIVDFKSSVCEIMLKDLNATLRAKKAIRALSEEELEEKEEATTTTTNEDDEAEEGEIFKIGEEEFQYVCLQLLPSTQRDQTDKRAEKRYRRITQKYWAFMTKVAESLNLKGTLEPRVVVARADSIGMPVKKVRAKPTEDKGNNKKQQQKGGGGKGKKGKVNHKQAILMANKKKKADEDIKRVAAIISYVTENCDNDADRIKQFTNQFNSLKKSGKIEGFGIIHGNLQLIDWCMDQWEQECVLHGTTSKRNFTFAVFVIRICYDTVHFFWEDLEPIQIGKIQCFFHLLGFAEAGADLCKWYLTQRKTLPNSGGKSKTAVEKAARYNFKRKLSPAELKLKTKLNFATFQLLHCGHLMQRSFDSQRDLRVAGFSPDAWQRKLLDAVDKKHSALVVAPTSSGKTFVSYYTMKTVLDTNKEKLQKRKGKTSDVGYVAYVAPSKALVNQVAAEVYSRYGAIVGILTPDYMQNIATCQVLVTVPQSLEALLLTPNWKKRLDYCILDEIHCIESDSLSTVVEGGASWERVIDLISCPFIALSATVGEPELFHKWLQQKQQRYNRDVDLVVHDKRWGDLKINVYSPPVDGCTDKYFVDDKYTFTRTDKAPEESSLHSIHPLLCLNIADFKDSKIVYTISLAPEECYKLFLAMAKQIQKADQKEDEFYDDEENDEVEISITNQYFPDDLRQSVADLIPDKHFGNKQAILRQQVYEYETKLKDILIACYDSRKGASNSILKDILGRLAAPVAAKLGNEMEYNSEKGFATKHITPLLLELNAKKKLPALVFSMDRRRCVQLALDQITLLEDKEKEARSTPGYIERIREIERFNEKVEKEMKRKRDKKEEKKNSKVKIQEKDAGISQKKDERLEDELSLKVIEGGVDPRYSFVKPSEKLQDEDVEYWIERITKSTEVTATMRLLISGLHRGIGVHHSALSRKYRCAVEVLFRAGHLKVVFATGTLAMGINMPCRTVVFCEDSPFLTPLMYRQMSGRAGRRGYDDVGNIVFFGLPKHRVHSLVSSQLTRLTGVQPLSSTLLLRILVNQKELSEDNQEKAASVLPSLTDPPMFSSALPEKHRAQIQKYTQFLMRYYYDLLFNIGLIDCKAQPQQLASLTAHLHKVEPGALLLHSLLQDNVLSKIVAPFSNSTAEVVAAELLTVLAYAANIVPLPHQDWNNFLSRTEKEKASRATGIVALPTNNEKVMPTINKFNRQVLDTFISSILHRSTLLESCDLPATTLPLSNIDFGAKQSNSGFIAELCSKAKETKLRTPFLAACGLLDTFTTASELADTAKPQLHIDACDIPWIGCFSDVAGNEMRLNACALDYFKHGQKKLIVAQNGLKEARAWEIIRDWNTMISLLSTGFEEMKKHEEHKENKQLLRSLQYLTYEFTQKFKSFNN